jgi:MFS superfamily sulfate permease-like transporter
MKWLNEAFPTRVIVAFAGGLAVVVLWRALERLIRQSWIIATIIKCEWPT